MRTSLLALLLGLAFTHAVAQAQEDATAHPKPPAQPLTIHDLHIALDIDGTLLNRRRGAVKVLNRDNKLWWHASGSLPGFFQWLVGPEEKIRASFFSIGSRYRTNDLKRAIVTPDGNDLRGRGIRRFEVVEDRSTFELFKDLAAVEFKAGQKLDLSRTFLIEDELFMVRPQQAGNLIFFPSLESGVFKGKDRIAWLTGYLDFLVERHNKTGRSLVDLNREYMFVPASPNEVDAFVDKLSIRDVHSFKEAGVIPNLKMFQKDSLFQRGEKILRRVNSEASAARKNRETKINTCLKSKLR